MMTGGLSDNREGFAPHSDRMRILAYLSRRIFSPWSSKRILALRSVLLPVISFITPFPKRLCSTRWPAFMSNTDDGMKSGSGATGREEASRKLLSTLRTPEAETGAKVGEMAGECETDGLWRS